MRTASSVWWWARRPLFTAFVLGCASSLQESGSLTPGRVALASLTWSWAPLLQIASLAAVWKARPRKLPFRQAVDQFFAGNAGWWLWLVAFSAFWPLASVSKWLIAAAAVAAWSFRIDYGFFRGPLGSAAPARDLLIQRALAWIPGILFFGGGALWPGLIEKLK